MNDLQKLKNAATYDGIDNRIVEFKEKIEMPSGLRVTGRFFYLTFRDKKITEAEFAQFIYDKIIRYCIPRKKINEAFERFNETHDERFITALHDQAKNLFVKSLKSHGAQLGEPGELIAFIILEYFFNAPQIACKMFLKTSEKMPVHGSDSVHVRMTDDGESLELFWGEAKMYSELSNAMEEALNSIFSFLYGKEDDIETRPPRDRDIDIIKDHPNVENENMRVALLKYFDPYEKESNHLKEIFMCMLGFDYYLYNHIEDRTDDAEVYFKTQYVKKIKEAITLFEKKIKSKHLKDFEFSLVLLPFQSLDNFRKEFFKHLGISGREIEECSDG